MATPTQKPQKKPWLAIVFIFAALVFLLLSFIAKKNSTKTQNSMQKNQHTEEYSDRVNEHLKMTAQRMKQQQDTFNLENERDKLNSNQVFTSSQSTSQSSSGVDFSTDTQWDDMADKLRNRESQHGEISGPADEVQYDLFQKQKEAEYTEAYKEAYSQAFVENARKHGYEIKLTEDFKIKSVRKIIQKKSPSLFEQN